MGALPPAPDGSHPRDTWAEFEANEEREGWFKGEGHAAMHVQGRRWGGCIKDRWNAKKGMPYKGSIYDAGPTFESYGVPHGSAGEFWIEFLDDFLYWLWLLVSLSSKPNSNYFLLIVSMGSADLAKAVPDHHKKFLADLVWVHEEVLDLTYLFLSIYLFIFIFL